MTKPLGKKPYWEMNTQELAEATREFDREFTSDSFGPAPGAAKERLKRAKRRAPGRPRIGQGSQVISLSIDRILLKRADAVAKREGISRAQIIARGLMLLLKAS